MEQFYMHHKTQTQ